MSQKFIEIAGRKIGYDFDPVVIAELGINHNGSLDVAIEMADAAWKSGAEFVKHQTHVVEDEMSAAARKVIPGNADISIYEIMQNCALDEKDEFVLKQHIESRGMVFISTPFSRAAANRLEKMGVSAYKIGSGECNNYPLIEHIARFGKPMIVSTGMNSIDSVSKTVAIMEKYNIQYALLHTTNLYPTPPHLVRLGAMTQLGEAFPNAVIGLSDHTTSNLACFGAVALGASILERHFTDRMDRIGPDIVNSMDPTSLKELIEGSIELSKMRGGFKAPLPEEQVTIDFAFATVVATSNIQRGEIFNENNIWVKRPGIGEIPAEFYFDLHGKRALSDIPADEHVKMADVENLNIVK